MNCKTNLSTKPADPKPLDKTENIIEISTYNWREYTNKQFEKNVSSIYENIVYWKKNIFLLPTGKGGRYFIDETARLIDAWVRCSPLKNIALKAVIIMPSLCYKNLAKTQSLKTILKL